MSARTVRDVTQKHWHTELSHEDGWDFVQIASVNEKSDFVLPADDREGVVQFTGWHVTLDINGLDEFIAQLQDVRARLNSPSQKTA